jgi:organic hydroperoxide reductase OsmC/OhrA
LALVFGRQVADFTSTELSTEAAVALDQDGKAFRISRSALTLRANVSDLDGAAFARLAGEAEKNCPVSKAHSVYNHAGRELDPMTAISKSSVKDGTHDPQSSTWSV